MLSNWFQYKHREIPISASQKEKPHSFCYCIVQIKAVHASQFRALFQNLPWCIFFACMLIDIFMHA